MQIRQLLLLATPLLASAQDVNGFVSTLESLGNAFTSQFGSGFAAVTSIGGSVFTVVTAAVPSGASSLATQVTSIGGSLYTVVASDAGAAASNPGSNLASIGTQVCGRSIWSQLQLTTHRSPALVAQSTLLSHLQDLPLLALLQAMVRRSQALVARWQPSSPPTLEQPSSAPRRQPSTDQHTL